MSNFCWSLQCRLLLTCCCCCLYLQTFAADEERGDGDEDVGDRGWVDPGDMVNYNKHSTYMGPLEGKETEFDCQIQLAECNQRLSARKDKQSNESHENQLIWLRHFARTLFDKLKIAEGDKQSKGSQRKIVEVELTRADRQSLLRIMSAKSTDSEAKGGEMFHDFLDLFDRIFVRVRENERWQTNLKDRVFKWCAEILPFVNLVILPPAVFILVVQALRLWNFSLPRFFAYCTAVCFVWSFIWTWIHLYKEKQAELSARLAALSVPQICLPKSAAYALMDYVKSMFSFSSDNECVQFHKDVQIDPLWEVPPILALSKTFSLFFLSPLEHFGTYLGRFVDNLFGQLPIHVWPLAVGLVLVILVFALLFLGQYNVSLLYGLLRLDKHVAPQGNRSSPAAVADGQVGRRRAGWAARPAISASAAADKAVSIRPEMAAASSSEESSQQSSPTLPVTRRRKRAQSSSR